MRKRNRIEWKKWAAAMGSGALLLQTPGCAETAAAWTAIFSGLTTGGVYYLIYRILE